MMNQPVNDQQRHQQYEKFYSFVSTNKNVRDEHEMKEPSRFPQPLPDAKGTVCGPKHYDKEDAIKDARALRDTMKGMGTDNDRVSTISGTRTHEQRIMIKRAYFENENRDLIQDFESELSGGFQKLIVG